MSFHVGINLMSEQYTFPRRCYVIMHFGVFKQLQVTSTSWFEATLLIWMLLLNVNTSRQITYPSNACLLVFPMSNTHQENAILSRSVRFVFKRFPWGLSPRNSCHNVSWPQHCIWVSWWLGSWLYTLWWHCIIESLVVYKSMLDAENSARIFFQ